jgi:hypothetical protein
MTPREHRHRRVENLRRPRTVMAEAFLRALIAWAAQRANDDDITQITIPTGTVTSSELAQVVCALIAIQKSPAVGEPVDQS